MTFGLLNQIIFALIFLAFIALHFNYMNKKYNTSLLSETPDIYRLAAKFVHISTYVTLSGIAISGLQIGFLFWLGHENSNLIEFTIWSHELLFSTAVWLISLHILAAICESDMTLFGALWFLFLKKRLEK